MPNKPNFSELADWCGQGGGVCEAMAALSHHCAEMLQVIDKVEWNDISENEKAVIDNFLSQHVKKSKSSSVEDKYSHHTTNMYRRQSSLFNDLLREVGSENDAVLKRALQSQTFSSFRNIYNLGTDDCDFENDLLEFMRLTEQKNDLKSALLFIKALLCKLDDPALTNFKISNHRLSFLKSIVVMGPVHFKNILKFETEMQRLALFRSAPARCIAVPSGSQVTASRSSSSRDTGVRFSSNPLEVGGAAAGFLTGMVAHRCTGLYYFEGKLRNPTTNTRIGWVSCDADYFWQNTSRAIVVPHLLGNDSESWAFDGQTGAFFSDAVAIAEHRLNSSNGKTKCVDTICHDESTVGSLDSDDLRKESICDSFLAYDRMRALGLPEFAVRHKMALAGVPDGSIDKYFSVSKESVQTTSDGCDGSDDILDGLFDLFSQTEPPDLLSTQLDEAYSQGGRCLPTSAKVRNAFTGDTHLSKLNDCRMKPSRSWQSGDVIGCFLDTNLGIMKFYVNSIEQGGPVTDVPIGPNGLSPAFCFGDGDIVFKLFTQRNIPKYLMRCQEKEVPSTEDKKETVVDSLPSCVSFNQKCYCSNDYDLDSIGYILSDSNFPEVFSPDCDFCIEISVYLDQPTFCDSKHSFTIFSFSSTFSADVSSLCVTDCGKCICVNIFGFVYTTSLMLSSETDYIFHPHQWHRLCFSFTPRTSTTMCVRVLVDGVNIPLVLDEPRSTRYKAEPNFPCLENRFCIGAAMQYSVAGDEFSPNIERLEESVGPNIVDNIRLQPGTTSATLMFDKHGTVAPDSVWVGDICDVRVWRESRTDEHVKEFAMRDSVVGNEKYLVVLWRFAEGIGRVLWNVQFGIADPERRSCGHARMVGDVVWSKFDPMTCLPRDPLALPSDVAASDNVPIQRKESCMDESASSGLSEILDNFCEQLARGATLLRGRDSMGGNIPFSSNFVALQKMSSSYGLIVGPNVLNFLLMNSSLRQVYRLLLFQLELSTDKKEVLVQTAHSLLCLLDINIKAIYDQKLSISAMGLKYSSNLSKKGADEKESFVSILLSTLLAYMRLDKSLHEMDTQCILNTTSGYPGVYSVIEAALNVVLRGFDIFFPALSDQALLLELLLIKKHLRHPDLPTIVTSKHVLRQFDNFTQRNDMYRIEEITCDPMLQLFNLPEQTVLRFLEGVCKWCYFYRSSDSVNDHRNPKYSYRGDSSSCFISKFIPRNIVPVHYCTTESLITEPCSLSFIADDGVILPKLGDIVQRGPQWRSGDDDGGVGKGGVVIKVFSWLGKFPGRGVTVRWAASRLQNSYCYGVPDSCLGSTPSSSNKFYEVSIRPRPETSLHRAPICRDVQVLPDETCALKEWTRKDLIYTPDDVFRSLVEEVGELTKRVVIRYMKSIAPLSWQKGKKLSWTENSLVGKLSGEELARLYADFYKDFSVISESTCAVLASSLSAVDSVFTNKSSTDCDGEDDSFQISRFYRVMKLLILDTSNNEFPDAARKSNDVPTSSHMLLNAIESVLLGCKVTLDENLATGGTGGILFGIPPVAKRVTRTSWITIRESDMNAIRKTSGCFGTESSASEVEWHWLSGEWEVVDTAINGDLAESKSKSNSEHTQFDFLTFKKRQLPKNISYFEEENILSQNSNRKWSTCVAVEPMRMHSGTYAWTVSIDSLGRRGHCIFGVAIEGASTGSYLGQDEFGWGLTMNNEFYNKGTRVVDSSGSCLRIGANSVLQIIVDTNSCDIKYVDTKQPYSAVSFPFSFEGHDTLYPAFSLYSPGDTISFVGTEELVDTTSYSPLLSTNVACPKTRSQSNSRRVLRFGCVNDSVVDYALILVPLLSRDLNLFMSLDQRDSIVKLISGPLFSFNLPRLIGNLMQWEYVSDYRIIELSSDLMDLLRLLNCKAFRVLLKADVSEAIASAPLTSSLEGSNGICHDLVVEVAAQVSVLISQYVGLISCSLIDLSGVDVWVYDNHEIALETKRDWHGLDMNFIGSQDISLATVVSNLSRFDVLCDRVTTSCRNSQLSRDLVGICASLATTLLAPAFASVVCPLSASAKDGELQSKTDELLWTWIFKHDKTSPGLRSMGGSSLTRGCHALFYTLLYHGGYLQAVGELVMRLESVRGIKSKLVLMMQASPPPFLLRIIKILGQVRLWAIHLHKMQDMTYEQIGGALVMRSLFLLELQPDVQHWTPSEAIDSCSVADDLFDTVLAFVKNFDLRLPLVKFAVMECSRRAMRRKAGFDCFSNLLNTLSDSCCGGSLPKLAFLHRLPATLRSGKYFLSGLEMCSLAVKNGIKGSFYYLYDGLVSELAAARVRGEVSLILCLLDCVAIILEEDDHNMLARTRIFYVLQDILDDTTNLQANGWNFSSYYRSVASKKSNVKDSASFTSHLVTKVVMKVVYLLAIQVASNSNPCTSASSSGVVPPALERIMSGPSTLSDVVFTMLYQQIKNVLNQISDQFTGQAQAQADCSKVSGDNVCVTISDDNMVIIQEATLLLSCVSTTPSCRKLLKEPKWLIILLTLSYQAPPLCQHRALRILANILPHLPPDSLDDLNIGDYATALLFPEDGYNFAGSTCVGRLAYTSPAVRFIYKLLDICGKEAWRPSLVQEFTIHSLNTVSLLVSCPAELHLRQQTSEKSSQHRYNKDITRSPYVLCLATAAEAVAVVRVLLSSSAWGEIVENVLTSCLTSLPDIDPHVHSNVMGGGNRSNIDSRNIVRLIACFGVLGGYVDSHYPGSIVKFENYEDGHCTIETGIVVNCSDENDIIEVELFSADHVTTECRPHVNVSLERTECLSRYPLDDVKISPLLLNTCFRSVFSLDIFSSSSDTYRSTSSSGLIFSSSHSESKTFDDEEKEELFLAEEKVEDSQQLLPLQVDDHFSDHVNITLMSTMACKALCNLLLSRPEAIDAMHAVSEPSVRKGNDMVAMLGIAGRASEDSKSICGMGDIAATEQYLATLLLVHNDLLEHERLALRQGARQLNPGKTEIGSETVPRVPLQNNCVTVVGSINDNDNDNDNDRCMSPLGGASVSVSLADTNDARGGDQSDSDSQMSSVYGEERENRSISTTRSGRSLGSSKSKKKRGERFPDDLSLDADGLENLTEEDQDQDRDVEVEDKPVPEDAQNFLTKEDRERHILYENSNVSSPWHCDDNNTGDTNHDIGVGDERALMVTQLEQMGFPTKWGKVALQLCGDDLGEAISYILIHGDALDEMSVEQEHEQHFDDSDKHVETTLNPSHADRRTSTFVGERSFQAYETPEDAPKDYRYLDSCTYLLPIYAEATVYSEKIGALFPGDDISVIEEIFQADFSNTLTSVKDSQPSVAWLKVLFSDFREEDDIEGDEDGYDDFDYNGFGVGGGSSDSRRVYAWIPTVDNAPFIESRKKLEVDTASLLNNKSSRAVVVPSDSAEAVGNIRQATPSSGPSLSQKVYPINATLRITGAHGAKVRRGVSMESEEVGTVDEGSLVSATAESFTVDGVIRMRITGHVEGWISKRVGLVEVVSYEAKSINGDFSSGECAAQKDKGKAPECDMRSLMELDDCMEICGGSDVFRRQDRFFGSLQGQQYLASDANKVETLESTMDDTRSRWLRVTEQQPLRSVTSVLTTLRGFSLFDIQQKIFQSCKILTTLYCRKSITIILLREAKRNLNSSGVVESAINTLFSISESCCFNETNPLRDLEWTNNKESTTCIPEDTEPISNIMNTIVEFRNSHGVLLASNAASGFGGIMHCQLERKNSASDPGRIIEVVSNFLTVVRLILFRNSSCVLSSCGVSTVSNQDLCMDDITAMGIQPGIVRLESVVGSSISSYLTSPDHSMENDEISGNHNEFRSLLLQGLLACLSRQIRLACSPRYAEHSWTDPSCLDDTDSDTLEAPNLQFAQFLTRVMCEPRADTNIVANIFRIWCQALKGSNMSLKFIAFKTLEELLSTMLKSNDKQLLAQCLSQLPHQRLSVLAARRMWYEMEDQPAFSRFLAAMSQLLAIVDRAKAVITSPQAKSSCESLNSVVKSTAQHNRVSTDYSMSERYVASFSAPTSHIELAPLKEVSGSWTVEAWVYLSAKNEVIIAAPSDETVRQNGGSYVKPSGEKFRFVADEGNSFGIGGGLFRAASVTDTSAAAGDGGFSFGSTSTFELASHSSLQNDGHIHDNSLGFPPKLPLLQRSDEKPGEKIAFESRMHDNLQHEDSTTSDHDSFFGKNGFSRSGPFAAGIVDKGFSLFGNDEGIRMSKEESIISNQSNLKSSIPNAKANSRCRIAKEKGEQKNRKEALSIATITGDDISQPVVLPSFLMSSSTGYIKLQAGGPAWPQSGRCDSCKDSLEVSDPVLDRVHCVSIGQHGSDSSEKVFDYSIPTATWTHLAFVYDKNDQSVCLIVDGGLIDAVDNVKMTLPQSVIGSARKGQSFAGLLAELRIWSTVRSPLEIRRDMFCDVSASHGLVSLLHFKHEELYGDCESSPTHVLDEVGMNSGRLCQCNIIRAMSPNTSVPRCPRFMLQDSEATEGVYGEGVGESFDVHELTGVLDFSNELCGDSAPYHLRQFSKGGQVVCIGYRRCTNPKDIPSDNMVGELVNDAFDIEGYLEWCELSVRTRIAGKIINDSQMSFKLVHNVLSQDLRSAVVLGAPEKLEWCLGLTCSGAITDGNFSGKVEIQTVTSLKPLLDYQSGAMRVEDASLGTNIDLNTRIFQGTDFDKKFGTNEKNVECVTVLCSVKKLDNPQLILVEVAPLLKYGSLSQPHFPSNISTTDVTAADGSPNASYLRAILSYKSAFDQYQNEWVSRTALFVSRNKLEEKNSFGVCNAHQSIWVDWIVSSISGVMVFGVISSSAARAIKTSSAESLSLCGSQSGCWSYSSTGIIQHGDRTVSTDPIGTSDKISIEINTIHGRISFYRNDVLLYEYYEICENEEMQAESECDWTQKGLKPFVQLQKSDDSVCLVSSPGSRPDSDAASLSTSDILNVSYSLNDMYGRQNFLVRQVSWGNTRVATGRGLLSYHPHRDLTPAEHNSVGFWAGNWVNGVQDGVQLWVREIFADANIHLQSSTKETLIEKCEKRVHGDFEIKGATEFEITAYLFQNGICLRKLTEEEGAPWITEWKQELGCAQRKRVKEGKDFEFLSVFNFVSRDFLLGGSNLAENSATDICQSRVVYVLKVIYKDGATVRDGVDIDQSKPIRTLSCGDIVRCFSKTSTSEGIPRYKISDGWISGRLRGGSHEEVVAVLEHHPPSDSLLHYEVLREDGAKVRELADMTSKELCVVPFGVILEVDERLAVVEGNCLETDVKMCMRLHILSPEEYRGWVSEKCHIVKSLSAEDLLSPEERRFSLELKRRSEIRRKRREREAIARLRDITKNSYLCNTRTIIAGSLDVSADRFFLLNKSRCSSGITLSNDFLTATCSGRSSARPMVLGSRGFSRGVHYWEVQVVRLIK